MARRVDIAAVPFVFGAAESLALPGPVLVRVLAELGASPAAAKALLHRLVGWGLLDLTRHGRVGVYRLAGRLASGFESVTGHRVEQSWDGRFHVLLYAVPETERRRRDVLRTVAQAHGYRALRPGVLANPWDTSAAFLDEVRVPGLVAGWLEIDRDEAAALVERAWGLSEIRAARLRAADDLEHLLGSSLPTDGPGAVRLLYERLGPALELLLADRDVPSALRPDDLGAGRLSALAARLGERLSPLAGPWVAGLAEELGYADLVVADPRWSASDRQPAGQQQADDEPHGERDDATHGHR